MPDICIGCGLTTDEDGNLVAHVTDWPFPISGDGTPSDVYCDPSTGKLKVRHYIQCERKVVTRTTDSGSLVTVVFDTPFSAAPIVVLTNYATGATPLVLVFTLHSVTSTQFEVYVQDNSGGSGGGSSVTFHYIAMEAS